MKRQMRRLIGKRHPSMWKGALVGIAAGAIGTIVMTQFQNGWNWASEQAKDKKKSVGEQAEEPQSENATSKVAGKIAAVAGHPLTKEQKEKGGNVVHYAFGTAMGTLYGLAMEVM